LSILLGEFWKLGAENSDEKSQHESDPVEDHSILSALAGFPPRATLTRHDVSGRIVAMQVVNRHALTDRRAQ
jgi:hypothetical protein